MKFKVGDVVEIIKINDLNSIPEGTKDAFMGARGRIISIDECYDYPCEIEFYDDNVKNLNCEHWAEDELKIIESNITLSLSQDEREILGNSLAHAYYMAKDESNIKLMEKIVKLEKKLIEAL